MLKLGSVTIIHLHHFLFQFQQEAQYILQMYQALLVSYQSLNLEIISTKAFLLRSNLMIVPLSFS